MAGNKNLYNSEPLEIVVEVLELANGIKLEREYVSITLTPQSGIATQVLIAPKLIDDYSPYVDPITLTLNKLNLSAQIPKDMCYSSVYPADYQSFVNFMLASYGLLVKADQWEIVHNSTVYPLTEGSVISADLSSDRYLTLRTTAAHPIFVAGMSFPLLVTDPQESVSQLILQIEGPESGEIGDDTTLLFVASGGLEPYTYSLVEGDVPVPLNGDGTALEGSLSTTGQFDYTIEVEDSLGQTTQVDGSMTVVLPEFTIANGAPDGYVKESYSHWYQFSGGVQPYSLVRTENMPMGLDLTSDGHLFGLADAGDFTFQGIFADALGRRFTLTDTIHVVGRPSEVVRVDTKQSLSDWLELSGGYSPLYGLQSHPAGSAWQPVELAHENVRGLQAGAVKLLRGYFVKTGLQQAQRHLGVALWVRKGFMAMGGCLFSTLDSDSGFEVSVSDLLDTQLRVTVLIDGVSYALATPSNIEVLDDELALITVQAAEGLLSIHRNEQLVTWLRIPDFPTRLVTADSPFTIGRRSNYPSGYQWNGTLTRVMVFNERLWGDQIAYLHNQGQGVEYRQLMEGPEAAQYVISFSSSPTLARVGQHYSLDVALNGPISIHAPLLCEGSLPFGLTLDAVDLARWTIEGIPSTPGIYESFWATEGSQETAGLTIQIVVE